MRLDERERPRCVKEAEVSSSSPFMRTGGTFWKALHKKIVSMSKVCDALTADKNFRNQFLHQAPYREVNSYNGFSF